MNITDLRHLSSEVFVLLPQHIDKTKTTEGKGHGSHHVCFVSNENNNVFVVSKKVFILETFFWRQIIVSVCSFAKFLKEDLKSDLTTQSHLSPI
jgi:hypothetical protein